jgi:hypothetical protein
VPQTWGDITRSADLPGGNYKYGVDMRHSNKGLFGSPDGHVKAHSLEEVRDMTRWSNYATSPEWDFRPLGSH